MKISIISDTHLGFASGTEREEDAFNHFQEALERSLDCDAILLPGDIFDSKIPEQSILARTMGLLVKPKLKSNKVEISSAGKDLDSVTPLNLSGIPLIAIHGTHERRIKGYMNPIQALEKAGFLIHIHGNGVILKKGEERVCIQGLSGVPDQYAESAIKEWSPKPQEGCYNIFTLHQSLKGFVNAPHTLPLEDLPEGFDLIVNGHIHERDETEVKGSKLLITGSTIQTQLTKESVNPRGFWFLDTGTGKLDFQELESQRKVYFLEFDSPTREEVEASVEKILSEPHELKPLIRIKIKGKEAFDFSKEVETKFDNAILSFRKVLAKESKPKARGLEEQRLSVQELGQKLLRENLEKAGLKPETFEAAFELLEDKSQEDALEILRSAAKDKHGEQSGQGNGPEDSKAVQAEPE